MAYLTFLTKMRFLEWSYADIGHDQDLLFPVPPDGMVPYETS